jgi:hypothetical protein
MPNRTGGAGGVSETNPPTVGGTSGGEGQQSSPDPRSDKPHYSDVTSTLDPLNPRGGAAPRGPSSQDPIPSKHSDPPSSAGAPSSSPDHPSTSEQPTPTNSSTPKPPPPPCLLGILFC